MKRILIISLSLSGFIGVFGQGATDAFRISQPDMKGTARFMSMGGAFGALGGDLSSLSQNPAGIGIYRNNDFGFTLDLDCQNVNSLSQGRSVDASQTRFLLNNIGAVFTMRLPSMTVPNLNIGFTYNKGASFNRKYAGEIPNLSNSLTNYIAGVCNSNELTKGDVETINGFDPYNPNDGGYPAPWISILGYDGYLVTPSGEGTDTRWFGQWQNNLTKGSGRFGIQEKGSLDEYNIALGGNIQNVFYWGMNFDIVNLNYTVNSIWNESLENAWIPIDRFASEDVQGTSDFSLGNYYNINGQGFNYQLGFIVKPIQELRLGFAFHTPTWYNLTETFGGYVNYDYSSGVSGTATTNNDVYGYNDMCFRTPWKLIGSIAGVIGNRLILSMDYEWTPYNTMHFAQAGSYNFFNGGGYEGPWDDWDYYSSPLMEGCGPKADTRASIGNIMDDQYYDTNQDISTYYQATNTIRLGAEFRVSPQFSLRAGYSHVSSPVKERVRNDREIIYTSGTLPSYRFDNSTNYITCGLGYRYQRFYVDLAYVYKNINATYHAYTPDPNPDINQSIPSPQAKLSMTNNQLVLSAGIKF